MKTKCPMMIIILWTFLLSGCVLTNSTDSGELSAGDAQTMNDNGNVGGDENRSGDGDVLASLTQTQKLTLLALLDSYDSNQEAIEAWKASEASVARLVELEKDLKFLILQLDSLNQQAQDALNMPDNSINATVAGSTSVQPLTRSNENTVNDIDLGTDKSSAPIMAGFTVQLTAVNSMKHLRTYWQKVKISNPVMFSEASPFYESISDSKGNNMFRLKVGKFETKAEAMRFCREFVASGGSCYATDNLKGTLLN